MPDEKVIDLDRLSRFHDNLKSNGLPLNNWQANKKYKVGYTVLQDGKLYRCKTEHTSTTTFDDTKWTEISVSSSGGGLDYWATSTSYSVDDIVVYNNQIWRCTTAHTSSSTFDSTKFTEISASGAGGISVWASNTQYAVNDVVIDSNLIWQCATAHTSTSTFDESKWVCISGGEISNGMEIVTLWEGKYNISNESSSSITNTITLEDSVENYKLLLVHMYAYDTSGDRYLKGNVLTIDASYITYNNSHSFISNFYANSSNNASLEYMFKDSLNMGIAWKNSTGSDTPYITKVQGIRKAKPIVSSGMKYETLWEGEAGVINSDGTTTVSLSSPYSGYKKLGITVNYRDGSSYVTKYHEFDGKSITTTSRLFACFGYDNSDYNIDNLKAIDSTTLSFSYNNAVLTKIIGISEGVQIPTGVQASRVTLFEGVYATSSQSNTMTTYMEIQDSIENYDQFEVTFDGSLSANNNKVVMTYNVSDIKYGHGTYRIQSIVDNNQYTTCTFGFYDSTHLSITWLNTGNGNWYDTSYNPHYGITKITGIKYIQPDSYSTEEKLIGTWIDGKPLYRKVFTPTGSGNIRSFSSGLDSTNYNIIKLYGDIDEGNIIVPLPYHGVDITFSVYYNKSNGDIYVTSSLSSYTIQYVAVEYTKN